MITFLAVLHIIACLGLIGLVLIQDSKGGGIFTSQSSSNSVLGASGATTLAQTMTKVVAGVFAITCISLSIMSAKADKSVIDTATSVAAASAVTTQPTTNPSAASVDSSKSTATSNDKTTPVEEPKK